MPEMITSSGLGGQIVDITPVNVPHGNAASARNEQQKAIALVGIYTEWIEAAINKCCSHFSMEQLRRSAADIVEETINVLIRDHKNINIDVWRVHQIIQQKVQLLCTQEQTSSSKL